MHKTQKETKTRKYKEKNFQTDFNKWLKNIFKTTGAYELKVADGISLGFSAVEEHQEMNLYSCKHGNFVFKIPDLGNQNPFDCFMLANTPAFLVVMFHAKQPGQKEFFMIDIDDWIAERKKDERKSLTEARAREIGKSYFLN